MIEQRTESSPLPYRRRTDADMVLQPHQHSSFSDGFGTPQELVLEAINVGINVLAITDHDRVNGAIEAWNFAEQMNLTNKTYARDHFEVVVGQEVTTTRGHLLLLGVSSSVVCNLSPEETAQAGVEQGAIVIVPHPGFNQAEGMSWEDTDELLAQGLVHGVELYNGAQQTLSHISYVLENIPGGKFLSGKVKQGEDSNVAALRRYRKAGSLEYAILGGHDNHLPTGIEKVTTLYPQGMDVFDAIRDRQTVFSTNFIPEFWGPRMYMKQRKLSRQLEEDRRNDRDGIMCYTIYER